MAINQRQRFRIFSRDSYTCQYCGRKAPEAILEVDHRVPVSRGGDDLDSNLVTSCRECNRGKFDVLLTVELKLSGGGPIDGWVWKTAVFAPMVWVWADAGGKPVPLMDEMISSQPGGFGWWRAKYGPAWYNKQRPGYEKLGERLKYYDRPDGAIAMLCGAYIPDDTYPFHHFKELTWQEPWQVLLQLDQTAGHADG